MSGAPVDVTHSSWPFLRFLLGMKSETQIPEWCLSTIVDCSSHLTELSIRDGFPIDAHASFIYVISLYANNDNCPLPFKYACF